MHSRNILYAVGHWKAEETDFPTVDLLAAWTYRLIGREDLFFPRLYSVLFWHLGGLALFFLAGDLVSIDGAIAALGFYLLIPYGVTASRSFQPDPLMVMLVILFWWAIHRWAREPAAFRWTLIAGLFGGFAIFIKLSAAFFVITGGLGAVLGRATLREILRRPLAYVMAGLGILPGAAYLIYHGAVKAQLDEVRPLLADRAKHSTDATVPVCPGRW